MRTMMKWFTPQGDGWISDAALRRDIRFGVHHLLTPAPGRFDIVLCRNVLMYFAPPLRTQAFDRIADALEPDGILMLGAGETVIGQTKRFAATAETRGFYVPIDDISQSKACVASR